MPDAPEAPPTDPESTRPAGGGADSFERLAAAQKIHRITEALEAADWNFIESKCLHLPWDGKGGLGEVAAQLWENPGIYSTTWRPLWRRLMRRYGFSLELPEPMDEKGLFHGWLHAWLQWARSAPRPRDGFPKGLLNANKDAKAAWREGWMAGLRSGGVKASEIPASLRGDVQVVLGAWREGRAPVREYRSKRLQSLAAETTAPAPFWEQAPEDDLLEFREAWAVAWVSFLDSCPPARLHAPPPKQLIHIPQVHDAWRNRVCRLLDNSDPHPLDLREWTRLPLGLADNHDILQAWLDAWVLEIEETHIPSLTILDIPLALRQDPRIVAAVQLKKLKFPPTVASAEELNSLYAGIQRQSPLFQRICGALASDAFPDWAIPQPLQKAADVLASFRAGWIRVLRTTPVPEEAIPRALRTSDEVYGAWRTGWETALREDPFPLRCAPEGLRGEEAFQETLFRSWAELALRQGWMSRGRKGDPGAEWWSKPGERLRIEESLERWISGWQILPQVRQPCTPLEPLAESPEEFWEKETPKPQLNTENPEGYVVAPYRIRSQHALFLMQVASVLHEDFLPEGIPDGFKDALAADGPGGSGCLASIFDTLVKQWKECVRLTPLSVHRLPRLLKADDEYEPLHAVWRSAWVDFLQHNPLPSQDLPDSIQGDPALREVWRLGWLHYARRAPVAISSLPRIWQADPELLAACRASWISHLQTAAVAEEALPPEFRGDEQVRAAWKSGWLRFVEGNAVEAEDIPEMLLGEVISSGLWRSGWLGYLLHVCGAPRTVPSELLAQDPEVNTAWIGAWERRIRRADFTLWDAESLPYKVYTQVGGHQWTIGSLLKNERIREIIYDRCARLALRHSEPLRHLPRFAADVPEAIALVFKHASIPIKWSEIPDRLKINGAVCRAWLEHHPKPADLMLYEFNKLTPEEASSESDAGILASPDRRKSSAARMLREAPWLFGVSWGNFEPLKKHPVIRRLAVAGFVSKLGTDPLMRALVPDSLKVEPELAAARS